MTLKKEENKGFRKLLRIFSMILGILFITASIAVLAVGLYIRANFEEHIPEEDFRLSVNGAPPEFYVYRFSDRVNRIGTQEALSAGGFSLPAKTYLTYREIPRPLVNAFISIEDKRFYRHHGVDWYRTVAAGITNVLGFSNGFGGSTITQQTVKNVTGKNEVTFRRKMQEILYALDLERIMDKSEILELYLNVISFSDGCVGVDQAAEYYFSKSPTELTVAECASIAAITNNPSYYNPIRYPEHNRARRDLILTQMFKQGYLDEEEYLNAKNEPLTLCVSSEKNADRIQSWYVDMVIEDVITDLCKQYGMSRSAASLKVLSGGLRIDIAMDPEIQKIVEEYYETSVRTPQNQNGEHAQSALIILDSHTGDILGVAGAVGKKNANRIQNFATQTLRPPGSAIKPITVYAPGLQNGVITWASVYDDVPVNFGNTGTKAWPKNATGVYRGLTNIAYAVAHSTNTVAVRVLEDVGLRESFRMAKEKFHLESLTDTGSVTDCDVAALALGQLNFGLTLRELTCAYTVFADAGSYHRWHSYYRVTDADGKILLSSPDASGIVLSEGNAAIMTKLMQGVIRDGTSSSVTLGKIMECAGKTGTTQNDHDRWFIGYTPDLICGVWCGYEYPEPIVGHNLCTGIWNDVMHLVTAEKGGRKTFDIPSDVIRITYCRDSGKLTDDACLFDPRGCRTETGWFVKGTEPCDFCDRHIFCETDEGSGGILHGDQPGTIPKRVGLIRAVRHFPIEVTVTDAQYIWRGDPRTLAPNNDPCRAYFEKDLQDHCGKSNVSLPFNRSCVSKDITQDPGFFVPPGDPDEESSVPDGSQRNNPFFPRIW